MSTYKIDPAHSEINFKIKHLMISTVTGQFTDYDATMVSSKEDFSDASISFEAKVNSINTNNSQRDQHLVSPDFFDAANHPTISFKSAKITPRGTDTYKLEGQLTMRGVTKPVTLDVEYLGTSKDFQNQDRYGFEVNGKVNRKEFGLTWNGVTEAGGVVVSDEVKLNLNLQMVKQSD